VAEQHAKRLYTKKDRFQRYSITMYIKCVQYSRLLVIVTAFRHGATVRGKRGGQRPPPRSRKKRRRRKRPTAAQQQQPTNEAAPGGQADGHCCYCAAVEAKKREQRANKISTSYSIRRDPFAFVSLPSLIVRKYHFGRYKTLLYISYYILIPPPFRKVRKPLEFDRSGRLSFFFFRPHRRSAGGWLAAAAAVGLVSVSLASRTVLQYIRPTRYCGATA